jgi:hypothetical protein
MKNLLFLMVFLSFSAYADSSKPDIMMCINKSHAAAIEFQYLNKDKSPEEILEKLKAQFPYFGTSFFKKIEDNLSSQWFSSVLDKGLFNQFYYKCMGIQSE